jgi:hypothetical protein
VNASNHLWCKPLRDKRTYARILENSAVCLLSRGVSVFGGRGWTKFREGGCDIHRLDGDEA